MEKGKGTAPELEAELEEIYGISETAPLEEVIDGGNIHGWLQHRVSQSEYKLAASVTRLIGRSQELLQEIEHIFSEKGSAASADVRDKDAARIYKAVSDSLLDGMPCDHANSVLEESEDKVVWKRNNCVHKMYWNEVGGDIGIYYFLREAFIRGFLSGTPFVFEKLDEDTNVIRRRKADE